MSLLSPGMIASLVTDMISRRLSERGMSQDLLARSVWLFFERRKCEPEPGGMFAVGNEEVDEAIDGAMGGKA